MIQQSGFNAMLLDMTTTHQIDFTALRNALCEICFPYWMVLWVTDKEIDGILAMWNGASTIHKQDKHHAVAED